MSTKRYSLAEYLRGSLPELRRKNKPKSLEDYLRLSGKNPDGRYARAVSDAITRSAIEGSRYGDTSEALLERGLLDDGYAKYLDTVRKRRLGDSIATAEEKRTAEMLSAREGYSKYLESYGRERDALKKSVLGQLTELEITDADLAFTIGINLGLDADEAAEIGDRAYGVISERITKECIELAYRSGMPLKELLDYASDRGLRENELKRLSKSIKAYSTDSEISDEELEKILEQASKNQ